MPIVNRAAGLKEEITAWRRDFHANPEILFEVHRTAGIVEEKLRSFGCDEVVPGIGRTGVVAVIKGRTNASGRVIGIRADMDALPMTETTSLPYASTVKGRAHACGHDGHTAMLLGAGPAALLKAGTPINRIRRLVPVGVSAIYRIKKEMESCPTTN